MEISNHVSAVKYFIKNNYIIWIITMFISYFFIDFFFGFKNLEYNDLLNICSKFLPISALPLFTTVFKNEIEDSIFTNILIKKINHNVIYILRLIIITIIYCALIKGVLLTYSFISNGVNENIIPIKDNLNVVIIDSLTIGLTYGAIFSLVLSFTKNISVALIISFSYLMINNTTSYKFLGILHQHRLLYHLEPLYKERIMINIALFFVSAVIFIKNRE